MDTLVENTGVPHQEKPHFVLHTEKEEIIHIENGDAEAFPFDGKSDGNETFDHEAAAETKPAADEMEAGYHYALGRR